MMTHGGCFFFFLSTAGETQRYILYITMPCYSGKKASCVSKCYTRYIIYPYITIPCTIHYYNMLMHGSFWFSELGPSTSGARPGLWRRWLKSWKRWTKMAQEWVKHGSNIWIKMEPGSFYRFYPHWIRPHPSEKTQQNCLLIGTTAVDFKRWW